MSFFIKGTVGGLMVMCSTYAFGQQEDLGGVEIRDKSLLSSSLNLKNQNTIILTQHDLEKLPYQTIDGILRQVPGLDIRSRGMAGVQSDISIDGGTFDQCLILINGHPVSDPQTGHNLMMLPIQSLGIAEIQIIKGPVASLYGVNALSGIINIITAKLLERKDYVSASVGTGNIGTGLDSFYANYNIQAGLHTQVTDAISNTTHLTWEQGNGYRPNTAFKSINAFNEATFRSEKFDASAQVGYKYIDFGANGFYAAPGDSLSSEKVNHLISGLKMTYRVHDKFKIESRISYNYKSDDYWYLPTPDRARNLHYQNNFHALVNANYQSKFGNWNAALNYRAEQLNSSNLGEHNRDFYGLILNYNKLFVEKLLVEATVNSSYYSEKMHWYPSVGIGYFLSQNHKLYANASMAERLPSFTDLYYTMPNVIMGNKDLLAEKSQSFEIGYQYKSRTRQFQFYYFQRTVDHFIDWVKEDVTAAWMPQNYHVVKTNGLSLLWKQQFSQEIAVFNKAFYRIGYTYLHPQLTLTEENVISRYAINALQHQLILGVGSNIGEKWNAYISSSYHNRIAYKAYWLLDAKLSYRFKTNVLSLSATNLTHTQIVEAGTNPIMGRWVNVSFMFKF